VSLLLSKFVYQGLDQRGIDGVVHGLSAVADSAGGSLRRLQSGRVQQYAAGVVTGTLVLVIVLVVFQ
jgi:NADH:ubiquinone oxidoreductase subunit 5 (subunit L)/multisubunit Na+/H+ antiporter MnhA subunit